MFGSMLFIHTTSEQFVLQTLLQVTKFILEKQSIHLGMQNVVFEGGFVEELRRKIELWKNSFMGKRYTAYEDNNKRSCSVLEHCLRVKVKREH